MSQGNTQYTYAMSQHDGADVNRNVHSYTLLDDPDGQSEKVWSFQTDTSQSNVGLLLSLQKRLHPGVTAGLMEDDYTADAAGDLYIGTLLTTADFGLSTQIRKTTTRTLDPGVNGNVTQTQVFDWGNLTTPARTYTSNLPDEQPELHGPLDVQPPGTDPGHGRRHALHHPGPEHLRRGVSHGPARHL